MDPKPDPARITGRLPRTPVDRLFGSDEAASTKQRVRSALGRQLFEYVLEQTAPQAKARSGRLLIVDHQQVSRDILSRNLQREGYTVEIEEDGACGIARLGEGIFDLVLWEVHLPTLNGPDLLARLKKDPALQHIPVVLLSEQHDTETVIRCIETGADDYLTKPFNPALLKARIRACLERKLLRDQEQRLLTTIRTQQERLDSELKEASDYLQSLLPAPMTTPFAVDWRFIPSSELGGDSFGYHWVDDDHFALYLLDVCGHGVGAALLSVAALNVLRSGAMQGIDFRQPGAVLAAMNRAFPMEQQNNRYFTLWYGVYQQSTGKLTYGSGGHPAVILLPPDELVPVPLKARGMMIGGMPGSRYPEQSHVIPPGSRFFLFSDGAYEITQPDGKVFTFDEFARMLAEIPRGSPVDLDNLVTHIRKLRGSSSLEDDLSLITIQF